MDSVPRLGPFHHYRIEDVFEEGRKLEMELSAARARILELEIGLLALLAEPLSTDLQEVKKLREENSRLKENNEQFRTYLTHLE